MENIADSTKRYLLWHFRDFYQRTCFFLSGWYIKRQGHMKVLLLVSSLLSFRFIFLLKMECFENEIRWTMIQLNLSFYAENQSPSEQDRSFQFCPHVTVRLERIWRWRGKKRINECGEKMIEKNHFTEHYSHGRGQINVINVWRIVLQARQCVSPTRMGAGNSAFFH